MFVDGDCHEGEHFPGEYMCIVCVLLPDETTYSMGLQVLIHIVKLSSDHIFEDFQAAAGSAQPILQVNAVQYVYTFINQVRSLLCSR